ncbi:MAG: hypothetical protein Q9160_002373 [Pyrenula sp. 1 TL-2023]
MTLNGLVNGCTSEDSTGDVNDAKATTLVVQKFGGTSIGKFPLDIVEDQAYKKAKSSWSAPRGAATPKPKEPQIVRVDHIQAAESHVKSEEILKQLRTAIDDECSQILRLLQAALTLGEIPPKSVDKVISAGEKLSCLFMVAMIRDNGISAEVVDLSTILHTSEATLLNQNFYDELAAALGNQIRACKATVPVVTGYFGPVPGGLLEKIGRGYTDLCAALVAIGSRARELHVFKEVDGVYSADPRKVPTAKLLASITPSEASELTFYGSEVIHPFTMEQVIRARIPIRIKNVTNPRGNGTKIFPDNITELEAISSSTAPKLIRNRSSSIITSRRSPKRPTAVTIKHNILVINVHSNKRSLSHGFFAKIFSVLDHWRLSIDLISTSEVHVSMALHSEVPLLNGRRDDDLQIVDRDLNGALNDLNSYGTVDIIPHMAILSLVGQQMKNMVGIAGRMFSTLGENGVNIEMISQGMKHAFAPLLILIEN